MKHDDKHTHNNKSIYTQDTCKIGRKTTYQLPPLNTYSHTKHIVHDIFNIIIYQPHNT